MNIIVTHFSFDTVISGGDVIAVEFAKAWKKQGHEVMIATHATGAAFFKSRSVDHAMIKVSKGAKAEKYGVFISAVVKTFSSIRPALFWNGIKPDVVFASSWMWTDLLPALILKNRYPASKLVVGCYLFPDKPFAKSYGSSWFNRWVFWVVFLLGIFITRKFADVIWTASKNDADELNKKYDLPCLNIRGGVDFKACSEVKAEHKLYDAVFLGRFHPQKNILELLEIWEIVVSNSLPEAKLLIIGDGFLKENILEVIEERKLGKNTSVMGSVDGLEKYKLLSSSRIFVSASHFDSGNLALDESLACGTPGVIYDLPLVDYPAGVIKVPCFDKNDFAKSIIEILEDTSARKVLSDEGREFAETLDWVIASKKALDFVKHN